MADQGISLDQKKHQIEGLANAQTILKTLEALEEGRSRFVGRWLYELIQNARDSWDPKRQLNVLLEAYPIRFGTGFISTHLLSRKVNVRGTLMGESASGTFEFVLDRTGLTDQEILRATDRSYNEFKASLNAKGALLLSGLEYRTD